MVGSAILDDFDSTSYKVKGSHIVTGGLFIRLELNQRQERRRAWRAARAQWAGFMKKFHFKYL